MNGDNQMRQYKFRAWDGTRMNYDYRDACLWNGLLVAEGDTILMQWTGLTDRSGKEIFEGDIVRIEDYDRGEVAFGKACFLIRCSGGHPIALENTLQQWLEVIGNRYEKEQA